MTYCSREELTRREFPVRTYDLTLSSGLRLKLAPLLPEVRARFPKLDVWKKLVFALHFGVVEPKLSPQDAAAFLNANPLDAAAAGRRIFALSAEYDRPGAAPRDETEHFFAVLEGIAGMRGER